MLLRLAPAIQEHILNLPKNINPAGISERALRPITMFDDNCQQLRAFTDIVSR